MARGKRRSREGSSAPAGAQPTATRDDATTADDARAPKRRRVDARTPQSPRSLSLSLSSSNSDNDASDTLYSLAQPVEVVDLTQESVDLAGSSSDFDEPSVQFVASVTRVVQGGARGRRAPVPDSAPLSVSGAIAVEGRDFSGSESDTLYSLAPGVGHSEGDSESDDDEEGGRRVRSPVPSGARSRRAPPTPVSAPRSRRPAAGATYALLGSPVGTSSSDSDFEGSSPSDSASESADASSESESEEDAPPPPRRQRRPRGPRGPRPPRQPRAPAYECDEHDADFLGEHVRSVRESAAPEELVMSLLPYQRESITWMLEQENNPAIRGGILADEMGMGKTLQTIALILANRKKEGPGAKATLVVCPLVAVHQWKFEIAKCTAPGALSVGVFHGADRPESEQEMTGDFDVILTTYSIVEADYRRQHNGYMRKGQKLFRKSPLHNVHWHRIVLDEAHFIKDRSCATARSVFALEADHRWSLTGTPLQNRVGELYSLVRFLRITPFSYYYCKLCPCKSLTWKFDGRSCHCCGHRSTSHFSWWNRNVLNPIMRNGAFGPGERAMELLQLILQRIMLRRTKIERAADLKLPPRVVRFCRRTLDAEENDFYEALYTQSRTHFMGYVASGSILNNYAHVFDLLLRLRQAVDHPFLVIHNPNKEGSGAEAAAVGARIGNAHVCGLCFDPSDDAIASACGHPFCRLCIGGYIATVTAGGEVPACPTCRVRLTIDMEQPPLAPPMGGDEAALAAKEGASRPADFVSQMVAPTRAVAKPIGGVKASILSRIDLSAWRSSTKIEALLEELNDMRTRDPNAKSLVFSQFVNFLDLIEWRLQLAGFKCWCKLDGRMNALQKAHAIRQFNEDADTTVFLISLKAGGVALNLTVASYCMVLDPWWNGAVEQQAIDRIHRLGQYRPITVVRFITRDTIEERILNLQTKKQFLFDMTVGGNSDAMARLSVDDLKYLFV